MIAFKLNEDGLIPAIVQDFHTGEVLMLGYMDLEALKRTLSERRTVFYSRSRKKYWVKGEESGHFQEVLEVLTDCDQDTVLIRVNQKGGACHLGYKTCFVHQLDPKGEVRKITQERMFDPNRIYRK